MMMHLEKGVRGGENFVVGSRGSPEKSTQEGKEFADQMRTTMRARKNI